MFLTLCEIFFIKIHEKDHIYIREGGRESSAYLIKKKEFQ